MRGRHIRIRTLLAVLVFAATVPLGLFGGWLVARSGGDQRAMADRQNIETARAVAITVDKTMDSTMKALRSLAVLDEELAPEHFGAFAERVLPTQPTWRALFLTDPAGRDLANTMAGFGDTDARRAWASRIAESGRPSVSDLARDPETGVLYVNVGVPVPRPEGSRRVLGARILASTFSELLRNQNPPPNGVVILLDAQRRIVARTLNEERYVGGPPTPGFAEASARMAEGSWRDHLLEGMPVHAALSRAPLSGWTVGLGLPAEEIDGPVRRSLVELAAAGLFVLGAGTISALAIGGLMFRSLAHATAAAQSLARGEPVPVRPSRVTELDQLAQGLGEAGAVLRAVLEKERAARAEAEAVNRSKDEFVAIVSHELRTPLSAISGWVQLLQGGSLDEAQRSHAIEVIARNTRLQAQLINDLLDVSRMVTGNLRVEMRPVELATVLASAVDAVRPDADKRRVEVFVELQPSAGLVEGDPDRLQQIVWNLLSNAIKFTPAGGRVDVALTSDGKEVALTVCDTGIGISPELLPHIFERFRQGVSTASRSQGGLGIGLALVLHLVELHGGQIDAESGGEGRGACFTVRLPACEQPALRAAADPGTPPVEPAVAGDEALAGLRALVVDDDDDARELVATVLARAGAAVVTAASAAEALRELDASHPDLLVSDIAMPGVTGLELMQEIRRRRGASFPAVALSAYGRAEDRDRALGAGFDFHLVKPVDARALVVAVARAA
ncbi:MAG TPA: ATP-binding protein, partial [Myxococcota bacterium]|nr:ATP-binding protein [Myxococcota bacterium]